MKIQVNTDHNIEGSEGLDQQTGAVVESTLGTSRNNYQRGSSSQR